MSIKYPFRPARPDVYPSGAVLFTQDVVREIFSNLELPPGLTSAVVEKVDAWEGESNAVVGGTGLPSNLYPNRDQAVRVVVEALYNLHRT